MDGNTKRQRKLLFLAIQVTPVYRPLKFPLCREAVVDSDDEFDFTRSSSSSTTLPLPATLGRRNLSLCWWINCSRRCRAYRRDFIEDACDACFRIRGVREEGRTALSLRMVEINSCGDLRIVARHSQTIRAVDRNGLRVKSLFDGEGKRRVVYLILRDRRGPQEPTHTTAFAIRFMDSEESSGLRIVESELHGLAVSCRQSIDSSHCWTTQPSKETPHTSTRLEETSFRPAVTVTPKSSRRLCAQASISSATQAVPNESVEKVVTPTRGEDCDDMEIEMAQRVLQRQYSACATPEWRTSTFLDQRTCLKGRLPESCSIDQVDRGGKNRTACDTLLVRRHLAFEPKILSDNRLTTSPVYESDHQSLSEPDGDLVTQVERQIVRRSTQDSSHDSTQSAVLMLPREELLTLSMQEATLTGRCFSPQPLSDVTRCRSLAWHVWISARDSTPNSFRRAVVDLILHENQHEDATETGTVLWLPAFLDTDCVWGQS
jgi:hypothetical protein